MIQAAFFFFFSPPRIVSRVSVGMKTRKNVGVCFLPVPQAATRIGYSVSLGKHKKPPPTCIVDNQPLVQSPALCRQPLETLRKLQHCGSPF